MNNIEYIAENLRKKIIVKNEIEKELSFATLKSYHVYRKKEELKNLIGDILVLKYYYYIEENKALLNTEERNIFINICHFINDKNTYISDLMDVEFDYYGVGKSSFIKALINNILFNIEHQLIFQSEGTELKPVFEKHIEEYRNSEDSKNKTFTIVNYFSKAGMKDKRYIQNVLLNVLFTKHRFAYDIDGGNYKKEAHDIELILSKNDKEITTVSGQLLRYEIIFNILNYIRLTC